MNAYEQMKNVYLAELQKRLPDISTDMIAELASALDIAAYGFDVKVKETGLTTYVDPVPQILKIYLVVKKTEGLASGTLQNYKRVLQSFFCWVRKQPKDVTANDVRMYLYEYSQTRRVSDRTLDKYREIICWFFGWAHAEEYIQRNPCKSLRPIKHEVKERQSLSQVEMEYMRMACQDKRERAILEFAYSTGCRVSELAGVKITDINWHDGSVHLLGKGRKHRTSFINAKAEVALMEYLQQRDDDNVHLFVSKRSPHNPIRKNMMEQIIRDMGKRSKIKRPVTAHMLRHTCATQAVNAGMPIEDVSKLLGHASVATTMIYAKVSTSKVQTEHARCVI